jgi:hypothetical protein
MANTTIPPMPPMLGYAVEGSLTSPAYPFIRVSSGIHSVTTISPANPQDDSYWFVILDANNPASKVKEWVVGANGGNTAVPSGLDQYMSNPAYIFGVLTQSISNAYVPQGDLYDYLVKHGAGRQLQYLEALNIHTGCGQASRCSYVLTGVGGPNPIGQTYEASSVNYPAQLVLSLMPQMNGKPPYSLCDSYTFWTR